MKKHKFDIKFRTLCQRRFMLAAHVLSQLEIVSLNKALLTTQPCKLSETAIHHIISLFLASKILIIFITLKSIS